VHNLQADRLIFEHLEPISSTFSPFGFAAYGPENTRDAAQV